MTSQSAPAVRFTIFAAARTGSNLLCGLLNSHPRILCHHGLFNAEGIHYAIDRRDGLDFGSCEERDADPAAFLDRVWSNSLGMRAVGFKLQREESASAEALLFGDAGIRKILLSRRNRVRTYVSKLIAEQTGLWESYGNASAARPDVRVYVDPAALWDDVNSIGDYYARLERTLSNSEQEFYSLEYESLTSPVELRNLLRFLDVSPCELSLTAPSFKRNSEGLSGAIVNFGELAAALRGSALEEDLYCSDLPQISEVRIAEGTKSQFMEGATYESERCDDSRARPIA